MQNPFTTTFSKAPEYTYIHTEKTEEILENFIYDNPSESVYKITGAVSYTHLRAHETVSYISYAVLCL